MGWFRYIKRNRLENRRPEKAVQLVRLDKVVRFQCQRQISPFCP